MKPTRASGGLAASAVLALAAACYAPAAKAQAVVPPTGASTPQETYGEWGARWWQWVQSMPSDQNPVTDSAPCGTGQWGPVFFLGGTFNNSGPVVRSCDVPAGKALFFPIINVFCAAPEDGHDAAAIAKTCREIFIDQVDPSSLKLTIDRKSVRNLDRYRAAEIFSLASVSGNVSDQGCGTPGTCYVGFRGTAYSDGFWAMLQPLTAGLHTVSFSGSIAGGPFAGFTVDVTYKLNILQPGS